MAKAPEPTAFIGKRGGDTAPRRGPAAVGPTRILPNRTSVPLPEPAPDPTAGLAPGGRIGSYELIRELGRGGMGMVFLARDVMLGRRVAIKVVIDAEPEFVERFLVEARATAQCHHENIVVIHEVGEHDGLPFMVLEHLDGRTLDKLMEDGPLRVERAIELMIPVARALSHAHELGIVHRDLKPENIFVTESGTVKVLDFGIAKAFGPQEKIAEGSSRSRRATPGLPMGMTQAGVVVGTPLYMSPEQVCGEPIDGRTDIWAFGVVLYWMVAGQHPLGDNLDYASICARILDVEPVQTLPDTLIDGRMAAVIGRCLRRHVDDRYASATELLDHLEAMLPGRRAKSLADGECPYPGLSSFGEADADRYFGRDADVRRMVERLREQPLVAVVGPSGAGKSSFVRAGVIPALHDSGERWDALALRPGLDPFANLASLVSQLASTMLVRDDDSERAARDELARRLRTEPGFLGSVLRTRASQREARQILYVDQFEELYTLVTDPEERRQFTACLLGAADDPTSPVRVVLSIRSDFVDRAAEDDAFISQLTRGMLFLGPLSRSGLLEAIARPAEMAGYRLESEALAADILDDLAGASSPLPLLQFAAARLWDERDRTSRQLTSAAYLEMGGIAGALAAHADRVLAETAPPERGLVRALFLRLITQDGTRAVADLGEVLTIGDPIALRRIVDRLADARLVVVDTETAEPTIELVHESLITSWPTLQSWIESDKEDHAFLAQLRAAAKQWDRRGRPDGLVWRGEALDDARRWRQRAPDHPLAPTERAYLDAVFAIADRAQLVRRRLWVGAFALVSAIAAGAIVAMLSIRDAEQSARQEATRANQALERIEAEQAERERAERAASTASEQAARASEKAARASEKAAKASAQVEMSREELREANAQLETIADEARSERDRARDAQRAAESEAARARRAETELRARERELQRTVTEKQALVDEKAARVRELEKKVRQISTDL